MVMVRRNTHRSKLISQPELLRLNGEPNESLSWDGYLEQGASWEETINPGLEGRILSFEAVLELDQELGPQDNFTLQVEIFDDGYRKSAKTDGGNITANETAKS